MRSTVLLLGVLALAGTASAVSTDRTVTSPGTVQAIARSGYSVAFLSGPYKGHCGSQVALWDLVSGGVRKLGKHPDLICEQGPSTGSAISDIAVAGNRALWLAYTGGNLRDWQLFTATSTKPAERQLAFHEVDVDAPPPIVLGVASDRVMPYSIGPTVNVLKANGAKAYTWQAPGKVTNTTSYGAQVAAFVAGGKCYVLSPAGAVQQVYSFAPGSVQEFALAGAGLVTQLAKGKVEIRKGASVKTLTLPAGAQMVDFAEGILLYKLHNQIRAVRVATGKDAFLRYGTFATLEHNGLSYSAGKKVFSVAEVYVQAALH